MARKSQTIEEKIMMKTFKITKKFVSGNLEGLTSTFTIEAESYKAPLNKVFKDFGSGSFIFTEIKEIAC
jgi:hypothetical protein